MSYVSTFVCNIGAWGYMGMNRVSPLEMGIEGGGRVYQIPSRSKIRATRRPKLNPIMECGGMEMKQDRNTAAGGCATRVRFAPARMPVHTSYSQARASLPKPEPGLIGAQPAVKIYESTNLMIKKPSVPQGLTIHKLGCSRTLVRSPGQQV